jgi:hypothetical protein
MARAASQIPRHTPTATILRYGAYIMSGQRLDLAKFRRLVEGG